MDLLLGDASKARDKLGWKPTVGFDQLVKMMVDADMVIAKKERALAEHDEREKAAQG